MEEQELDSGILTNIALSIMRDPEGMNNLIDSASNTPDPAKGVAQYLMMLFDAISALLEQTGVAFDFGVITAKGGVVDNLVEEVAQILSEAGIETGPGFEKSMIGFFLEMVKSSAQAEEQEGTPLPAAPDPANVSGTTSAGMGGGR